MDSKRCCGCKRTKPLEAFYRNRAEADGRHHTCRECEQKREARRRQKRERRQYMTEYLKKWKEENAGYFSEWVAKNPERRRSQSRYRVRQYHERKRAAISQLTLAQWEWLLEQSDHRCVYCGRHESEVGTLHMEHIKPVSRGGHFTVHNIRPACKSCNSRKGGRTPLEAGMEMVIVINTLEKAEQLDLFGD